jgi:RNA polymerase sigma factor (sigma-70 family)
MKPPDALTAAILAGADAARAGARAMRVPDRDVDDIVQDALLATWQRAQRGDFRDDPAPLRVYIFVTAKNAALNHWRKLGRVDLPGDLPGVAVDPLPQLEARDELRALPLPAYLRAIVELYAAGDSLHAVADALGIPPGTIATRLRAMRAKLRRK